jgi:outer membrane immunogenic protein
MGLNLGGGAGKNVQDISGGRWEGDEYPSVDSNGSHFIYGGQAGYNYFFNNILVGLEGDISGSDYEKITPDAPYSGASVGQQVGIIATLRARAGVAVIDSTLVYVTGGLALTNGDVTLKDGVDHTSGTTDNITSYGWVAGVGAEYAINRNWSVKGEYLHIETSGDAHTYSITEDENYSSSNTFTDDVVRIGLNYRF